MRSYGARKTSWGSLSINISSLWDWRPGIETWSQELRDARHTGLDLSNELTAGCFQALSHPRHVFCVILDSTGLRLTALGGGKAAQGVTPTAWPQNDR